MNTPSPSHLSPVVNASQEPRVNAVIASLFDNARSAVVICDDDGVICYANAAAEKWLGRAADDLIGQMEQEVYGVVQYSQLVAAQSALSESCRAYAFRLAGPRDGDDVDLSAELYEAKLSDVVMRVLLIHAAAELAAHACQRVRGQSCAKYNDSRVSV